MDSFFLLLWLSLVDHQQSVFMQEHVPGTYEMNPLLGDKPSSQDMLLFGLVGTTTAYFADKTITPTSHIIMDSVITSERWNVEANERVRQGYDRGQPIMIGITIHF